jgi:GNAT superfamily N-acetyltransferase
MEARNLTLIGDVAKIIEMEIRPPARFQVAYASRNYRDQLAALYLVAYGVEIATDLAASQKEMEDMFNGEFGELWANASPLLLKNAKPVAALFTVRKAPWESTPTCPFIIDLMVDTLYRRQGLAAFLIWRTAAAVHKENISHIALRVLADNNPAISLYRKLHFVPWEGR